MSSRLVLGAVGEAGVLNEFGKQEPGGQQDALGGLGALPSDRRHWDLNVVCSSPNPIPVAQVCPWRGHLAPQAAQLLGIPGPP